MAFTRYTTDRNASVWVADRDGSNARQIAANGHGGALSPDGRRVAFYAITKRAQGFPVLFVRRIAGGKPLRIGQVAGVSVWSPDSRHLAVSDGKALVLVDARSGARRRLASGRVYLGSVSFSPDGRFVAFGRANTGVGRRYRSDIFIVRLSDGGTRQLTHDDHSDMPVWGRIWIVYRSFHFDGEWSIGRLRLIHADGSGDRLFARGGERASLAQRGLDPREFSADGTRLLACQAYEFSCAPLTFTVPAGRSHTLRIGLRPGELASAGDLSRDGREILVDVGRFDSDLHHRVYALPFEGGKPRLIAREATAASWAP